ncbi:MAG: putative glutamate--cysteine ligase [Synechococcus sp. EAC657]|nr:putative glutamate--cysteine ligase [Synechococcus sp. EAC657]MEC7247875.1 glutamate--cysteine ligase [Cyanobacteriota bacterium]MEC7896281.1 glutamate--cysteine ligase [Cyanobacteriota bacterium]MEC8096552.1 glutamate--cysteine ligase [Cyanobacteriota bacterium]|tara:strand:- start:542 stop:1690 length:1149 start_codon:yes stop_codon:yes gene_type:complete
MSSDRLLKGFEVELFTGREDGRNVGVAARAKQELTGFVTEPDHRNLEYVTAPQADYEGLSEALLSPRRRLRRWLMDQNLTLLPGSTLSLGDTQHFERSDPNNPYHALIEATYGTAVVTASVHVNLGIDDPEDLFAALRLVRCEAALLLSLSASSPFLNGKVTGAHSQRWLQFPLTPSRVPLFRDHQHFITWTEAQIDAGTMHNVRHLWTSVRANGPDRPHRLNRLELRICDLITDPDMLLAVTALLELRVQQVLRDPQSHDPLHSSSLSLEELEILSMNNDRAAAQSSLDATLCDWHDGHERSCRDWLKQLIDSVVPLAHELGLHEQLKPLQSILMHGNQAMRWLDGIDRGDTIEAMLRSSISAMQDEEMRGVCVSAERALG